MALNGSPQGKEFAQENCHQQAPTCQKPGAGVGLPGIPSVASHRPQGEAYSAEAKLSPGVEVEEKGW